MDRKLKIRILDRKWDALTKRGLSRPKSDSENKKRMKEAHGY